MFRHVMEHVPPTAQAIVLAHVRPLVHHAKGLVRVVLQVVKLTVLEVVVPIVLVVAKPHVQRLVQTRVRVIVLVVVRQAVLLHVREHALGGVQVVVVVVVKVLVPAVVALVVVEVVHHVLLLALIHAKRKLRRDVRIAQHNAAEIVTMNVLTAVGDSAILRAAVIVKESAVEIAM